MKLTVVIATYNRPALLRRLLAQLGEQRGVEGSFEVCVVDDGSEPAVTVAGLQPPFELRLVRQRNAGAAAARHAGVLAARGELVVFIDDDMQVGADFLAQHVAAHGARTVVLGRIQADPGVAMPLFERWNAALIERKAEALRHGRMAPRGNLLFTGNVSLHRADYLAVGGFDATLPHSEDIELGMRLEQAGVEFRYSDAACTLHGSDHTSLEKWRARAVKYGRCDQRIARKHPGLRDANPWRFAFELHPLLRPFVAAAVAAPRAAEAVAGAGFVAATGADALGLTRPALAATTLVYAMDYFRGVREEAGTMKGAIDELVGFAARFEPGVATRALQALREDQAVLRAYEAKYGHATPSQGSLPADVVQKVGLQMLAAVRVMRALHAEGHTLAAKAMSRLIRHLYGSDLHWEAELAPGVMLVHGMGLAISHGARVGRGCILFQHVTLGMGIDAQTRQTGAPTLEENVHVGPGATLLGPITIGRDSKIMAGAVVTASVPPGSLVESPSPTVRSRSRPAA